MNVFKYNILSIRTIFDIFFKKEGNKVTCFKESSWFQQCSFHLCGALTVCRYWSNFKMGQSIQEWTKSNLWKAAFKKFEGAVNITLQNGNTRQNYEQSIAPILQNS